MADANTIPVGACVSYSYGFLVANGAALAPVCLLVGLSTGLSTLVGTSPESASSALAFVAMLASILVGAVFSAAVLRLAIHGERRGPLGVAFGREEMQLVLVNLVVGLAVAPVVVVMVVGFAFATAGSPEGMTAAMELMTADPQAFAEALRASLGPQGTMALLGFMLICVAIMIFIFVKLFLAQAATIGERTPVTFAVWGWSKGDFWRLLIAILATTAPSVLLAGVLNGLLASTFANAAGPLVFVMGTIEGSVSALLTIPSLALGAKLYQGLRPTDFKPR